MGTNRVSLCLQALWEGEVSKRKVRVERITFRRQIGVTASGERVIKEVQQLSDGSERTIYQGVTGISARDWRCVEYGEQCPELVNKGSQP